MNFSNDFLRKCSETRDLGYQPNFQVGMLVGRGFADLGFEAFCMLPGSKMVSLFTGEVSTLPEEHVHHFFHIPDADTLVQEIAREGSLVEHLRHQDGRQWEVGVRSSQRGDILEFVGPTITLALIEAFQAVLSDRHSFRDVKSSAL